MNSLNPKTKRLRVADRSLHQARQSLQGVLIALQDLPRSQISALTEVLDATQAAIESLDLAAEKLDEARMDAAADNE